MGWVKRKSIHLDKFFYQGPLQAFVTICFYRKFDVITAGLANQIVTLLNDMEKRYQFIFLVYCLMPDHLHILIQIKEESQNLIDLIHLIKQNISFQLKGQYPNRQLWQDRFYEHIVRSHNELIKIAHYILENPVRKRRVVDFREWPYSGGYFLKLWKSHDQ